MPGLPGSADTVSTSHAAIGLACGATGMRERLRPPLVLLRPAERAGMVFDRRTMRRLSRRRHPQGGGGERADTGVRMLKLRGVPARVKQKHRTPDVPHRHMPVRILLGRGPALSALRMADGDQEQEERGHPRKNRPFHDVSGGTRLPVLRRAGVCPHHRDRR